MSQGCLVYFLMLPWFPCMFLMFCFSVDQQGLTDVDTKNLIELQQLSWMWWCPLTTVSPAICLMVDGKHCTVQGVPSRTVNFGHSKGYRSTHVCIFQRETGIYRNTTFFEHLYSSWLMHCSIHIMQPISCQVLIGTSPTNTLPAEIRNEMEWWKWWECINRPWNQW